MAAIDLDAYLTRIGYTGPRTPTLDTLREVHRCHVCTIPFENLDVLLGRRIAIDAASVVRKLVHDRRGGYCFEQNLLLGLALRALGFKITTIGGRIRWQLPAETPSGMTHMILLVEAEGRAHIADAGIGSMSLSAPLALDTEATQPTPHEPRRLLRHGNGWMQQVLLTSGWSDVVRFTTEELHPIDYEIANWFTSTHPQSRFTQNLAIAIAGVGCRHTLFNREFTTRHADGRVESRTLATPDELLAVLAQPFGLPFPAGTRFTAPALSWPQ